MVAVLAFIHVDGGASAAATASARARVVRTRERYVQAYETLTGRSFDDWMA